MAEPADGAVCERDIGERKRAALAAHDGEALDSSGYAFTGGAGRARSRSDLSSEACAATALSMSGWPAAASQARLPQASARDRIREPHGNRDGVEDGAEVGRTCRRACLDPDRGHCADRAPSQCQRTFPLVADRQQERCAAVTEPVQCLRQLRRIGSGEAGFDDPVGGAVTAGSSVSSPPQATSASRLAAISASRAPISALACAAAARNLSLSRRSMAICACPKRGCNAQRQRASRDQRPNRVGDGQWRSQGRSNERT